MARATPCLCIVCGMAHNSADELGRHLVNSPGCLATLQLGGPMANRIGGRPAPAKKLRAHAAPVKDLDSEAKGPADESTGGSGTAGSWTRLSGKEYPDTLTATARQRDQQTRARAAAAQPVANPESSILRSHDV